MNSLTSIIFKNENRNDISQKDGIKGKLFSILSFIIVFCALAGFMVWVSIYITQKLDQIHQPYAFIAIMLLGNFLILFLESIFQALNSLYFSKDLKILLRMPIKPHNIVHSKLIKLITSEYQMELIMLAIPMIVFGIIHQMSFSFYIYIAIILLILPVIPISITATIVSIIMRFANLIKNKTKVIYITIILATLLLNIFLLSISEPLSVLDEKIFMIENSLATELSNSFKLMLPITNSLQNYDNILGIKHLASYIFISILTYIIAIFIISPIYLKGCIGTVINGNKRKYKEKLELTLEDFKQNTQKRAYINKEFKVIKRSPIFLIQCLIMPILSAIFIFFICVAFVATIKSIDTNLVYEIRKIFNSSWIAGGFLAITQILYMLSFSSIIAISKEERSSILTKYIPIKLSKQLHFKLKIGKVINFISTIAVVALYYLCTTNIFYSILILFISIGMNSLGEKIKILIDLRNPRTKWDSEYAMMKQNTNVMYELFYTMIVILIIILLGLIITNINIYLIITLLAITIINIKFNQYIYYNDSKIFKNLY